MNDEMEGKPISGLPEKTYRLLSQAKAGRDITTRDDQYEFSALMDSAKVCRQSGSRFRLIDSGILDRSHLEWLAGAGADLYFTDTVSRSAHDLEMIGLAAQKSRSLLAYLIMGNLRDEGEASGLSFPELANLAKRGLFLHISSRNRKRDFSLLSQLACACRSGGSWLVYYHHGPLSPSLGEIARNGAWIHLSDKSLQEPADTDLLLDLAALARSSGSGVVFHMERELEEAVLYELVNSGVFVLFKSSHVDFKYPVKSLEQEARKRKLDFRTFYLFPTFFL